ncbi:AbgT family transporter [Escherichia coli]|uniref:AbgT family transporter n=1 Tax=Escherichia coli TaxID=562 RepID=UPI0028931FCB|nr:AbgT family transporter [Escherichia coli]WNK04157.1 AbgT family transporter [Escherichia coli]
MEFVRFFQIWLLILLDFPLWGLFWSLFLGGERSGLISAALRLIVTKAPAKVTTMAVVFADIISNIVSELGYVVLILLSAILFHSLGRHPLAGLAAAFAGVSGGYSANLLLVTIDPLLSGITQQAAQIISSDYIVGAESNWYFIFF